MSATSFSLTLEPAGFFPNLFGRSLLELHSLTSNAAAFAAFMWRSVGEGYWLERSDWTLADWQQRLGDIKVSFIVAYLDGEPVGSFELSRHEDCTWIEGFGLLPAYRGEGLSHDLLTRAVERGFAGGKGLIRLETATDDHPAALPLYQSQGFRIVATRPLESPMGEGSDQA